MASLKSNAPVVVGAREFDPEIKDMASYIHNYKIDSDLAVSQISAGVLETVMANFHVNSVRNCPLRLS